MTDIEALIKIRVQEEVSKAMTNARNEVLRLQRETERGKQFVQGFFGTFTGPMGAMGAGAALATLTAKAVTMASSLQALERRAQSVFQGSFAKMREEAERFGQAVGRSSSDLLGYQTAIGAIGRGAGITGPLLEEISTKATQLAIDFGSFQNIADDQAFDLISRGLRGQARALTEYGVFLDDVTLQEYAHRQGIQDKIAEMSEGQQMYLRYNMLTEQLAEVEGDAAENASEFSNQAKELSGKVQDLFEVLGNPIMAGVADEISAINLLLGGTVGLIEGLTEKWQIYQTVINAPKNIVLGMASGQSFSDALMSSSKPLYSKYMSRESDIPGPDANEVNKRTQAMRNYYKSLGDGSRSSEKAAKDAEDIKEAMEELGKEYRDAARDMQKAIKDLDKEHTERMKSIREEIEKTTKAQKDLETQNNRTMQSFANDEADLILREKKNIAEMERDLAELERERESIVQSPDRSIPIALQEKIDNLRADIARSKTDVDEASKLLGPRTKTALETRGNRSDFGNDLADLRARREQEMEDYRGRATEYANEKKALGDKEKAEEAAYRKSRGEMGTTLDALQSFGSDYESMMDNMVTVTEQTLEDLKNRLVDLKGVAADMRTIFDENLDTFGGVTPVSERLRKRTGISDGETTSSSTTVSTGSSIPDDLLQYARTGAYDETTSLTVLAARKANEEYFADKYQREEAERLARQEEIARRAASRLPKLAEGGIVTRPTIALIGEAGPEAVVPLRGKGNSAAGISITIQSMVVHKEADVDAVMSRLAREIRKQLVNSA